MNYPSCALLGAILLSVSVPSPAAKPEFVPLQVPPGKSAEDVKPRREVRVEDPVILELRAHRHEDGSLHFECDDSHADSVGSKHGSDKP